MKKLLPWLMVLGIIFVASCTKTASADASDKSSQSSANNTGTAVQETEKQLAAVPLKAAPWYGEKLEAMGFYVFPEPQAMPPFSVMGMDGKTIGIDSLAGKVVLLNFWATWCPPCRSEMPTMETLHKFMNGMNFTIAAISVGEKRSTVSSFLAESPYSFPIYLDESGAVSRSFVGQGIPTTYILDKKGRAIAGVIGALSYSEPFVLELFKDLAEKL